MQDQDQDQNQPELDAANAECAGQPAQLTAAQRAVQNVADAANRGEEGPFAAAAAQLADAGHLTRSYGCGCGEEYPPATYARNCRKCIRHDCAPAASVFYTVTAR